MSLRGRSWRGSAGIVIWNGVAPGAAAEFERWHDEEHLAERLAIPGFLRARRGVAVDGSARYLTLYDVADAYAIGQGAYPARLDAPTPWTRRVMPLMRDTARILCRVSESLGRGEGAGEGDRLVALRLPETVSLAEEVRASLAGEAARLVSEGLLVSATLLLRDDALTARRTAEHALRAERVATPAGALVGEARDHDAATAAAGRLAGILGAEPGGPACVYRIQVDRSAG
ncbi:hypothetical protein [Salinarimonas rosea]|uniref:hypothetical protein n=1 Tax=Salinarimonas rosea TaxID=552063 RepID=UPI0004124CDF|nr:hypothetical protein [Salinarimonas rosea]